MGSVVNKKVKETVSNMTVSFMPSPGPDARRQLLDDECVVVLTELDTMEESLL